MLDLKILFICRKKDKYSNLCKNFLRKKFKNIKIIESDRSKKKKIPLSFKWNGDLILSFRSHIILKNKIINKAKIACINFHPSSPKYRGFGGVNYAIYNNDKYFGCTAHLIEDEKIDSGKILNVRKFRLLGNESLKIILEKTHKNLFLQFKSIVTSIINKKDTSYLIKKSNKERWSKTYNNKKKLDNFYQIMENEKNIKNKIRATYLNDEYLPYYIINNKKKMITKKDIKKILKK